MSSWTMSSTMSVEFRKIVFCCFWQRSSTYIWHGILIYDICFEWMAASFGAIIANKHNSYIFRMWNMGLSTFFMISRKAMRICMSTTSNFHWLNSGLSTYFWWCFWIVEAATRHHFWTHILIWTLIRISKLIIYATLICRSIINTTVRASDIPVWLWHCGHPTDSTYHISSRFPSFIAACQIISMMRIIVDHGWSIFISNSIFSRLHFLIFDEIIMSSLDRVCMMWVLVSSMTLMILKLLLQLLIANSNHRTRSISLVGTYALALRCLSSCLRLSVRTYKNNITLI